MAHYDMIIVLAALSLGAAVPVWTSDKTHCPRADAPPFAIVFELRGVHSHVIPSGIAFARELGAHHVFVIRGVPRNSLGVGELVEWLALPNVTRVTVDPADFEGSLRCYLRHQRLALLIWQSADRLAASSADALQDRFYAQLARYNPSLPLFAGCHKKASGAQKLGEAARLYGLKAVIPFTYTPENYARMSASWADDDGTLRPTFVWPAYFGERATRTATRPRRCLANQTVSFYVPAMISYKRRNWEALRGLADLDTSGVRVTVDVLSHSRGEDGKRFEAVQAHLSNTTGGRVVLRATPIDWVPALEAMLRSSYILPLIDESVPAQAHYSNGSRLPSALMLATGLGTPLVLWDQLAKAFELGGQLLTSQLTYSDSAGFVGAMQRAVDICRGRTLEQQRLYEHLRAAVRSSVYAEDGQLASFSRARKLACAGANTGVMNRMGEKLGRTQCMCCDVPVRRASSRAGPVT